MKVTFIAMGFALLLLGSSETGRAASPWPAEANTAAVKLTTVDSDLDDSNMSGAFWNPVTRTLWLANNWGRFFALVEDGKGSFLLATNSIGTEAKWYPGGDLEGICQADFSQSIAYLGDENGWIREYNVSDFGVVSQNRSWDIRAQCPEVSGAGPEGITFVPDEWLAREGFRAGDGALYTSTNGMGGLMFVGHQVQGYVHVFDLNRVNNSYGYVGRYRTGQTETAGLEFDRSTGKLYIWHNIGVNYLEVTELNSYVDGADRRLRQIVEYTGPRSGNLEGFAVMPTGETNNWCFVADDDNTGKEAIAWYRQFEPSEDADTDLLPDGWELWHFGALAQTTGAADSDSNNMSNVHEYLAGTDPTNPASRLAVTSIAVLTDSEVVIEWLSVSNKAYDIMSCTNIAEGFDTVVAVGVPADPPMNCFTTSVESATTVFYQILLNL